MSETSGKSISTRRHKLEKIIPTAVHDISINNLTYRTRPFDVFFRGKLILFI